MTDEPAPAASALRYRPDIDGLRAVAILSVILCHAGVSGLSGGFVGVDVFFVISGYLITSLIVADVAKGRYSVAEFYERRIRRIFPALLLVLGVFVPLCSWLLFPDDLRTFAATVVATALFGSNFYLWRYSGYFDPAAELNPLTHTWSLAVEEQFYILYPLLLAGLLWGRRRLAPVVLGVVLLGSLAFAVLSLGRHPRAAFYLPFSRAWELLLGALVALDLLSPIRRGWIRNLLSGAGLIAIVGSVVGYSEQTPFPGLLALPPCLGAACLILAGGSGPSAAGRLLSSRPLVFIGLISYSLYLWHWPLLVFLRHYLAVSHLPPAASGGALVAAVGLATLSWRFVERPFRNRANFGRRRIFAGAALGIATIAASGTTVLFANGMPGRFTPEIRAVMQARESWPRDPCIARTAVDVAAGKLCRLGAPGSSSPSFFLWGDSHAAVLRGAVDHAAKDAGVSGTYAINGGCPPLLGVDRVRAWFGTACVDFNRAVIAALTAHDAPGTVVVAARWALWGTGSPYKQEFLKPIFLVDDQSKVESYAENGAVLRRGLARSIATLRAAGRRVVLVGPVPEVGWDVPKVMAMKQRLGFGISVAPTLAEFREREQLVLPLLEQSAHELGVEVVWPHRALCDQELCRVEEGGLPLYLDDDHLSVYGNSVVTATFAPIFR